MGREFGRVYRASDNCSVKVINRVPGQKPCIDGLFTFFRLFPALSELRLMVERRKHIYKTAPYSISCIQTLTPFVYLLTKTPLILLAVFH